MRGIGAAVARLPNYDRIGSLRAVPNGTVLFREGDPGSQVLLIHSGQVKLSCASRSGKVLNVKLATSGDVLGLSAALSGANHETAAEAVGSTLVKAIANDEFLRFLNRNAGEALLAAQRLSEDYRLALQGARRLALSSVTGRIAGILLDWSGASDDDNSQIRFIMSMSHGQLAEFVGTSRETVTRILAELQKNKTIVIRGATVHILVPKKLAELAA
jgi:CRP/FNR family transcriptional regulator, cyclic AMP receptor protein